MIIKLIFKIITHFENPLKYNIKSELKFILKNIFKQPYKKFFKVNKIEDYQIIIQNSLI